MKNTALKKTVLSMIFLFLSSTFLLAQSNGDKILGVWLSEKQDGKIEIYKSGDKYFGKLIWGKDMYEKDGVTSKKDVNNTNKNLKTRNLKNLIMLTDFVFDGTTWGEGNIYDPQAGKTYSCIMKLKGNILNIRGYVGLSLFGRTSEWTRVK